MSQDVSVEAEEISTHSKGALYITLLGSEWNSLAGGLSTFNRELAIHLSQQQNVRVSLLVPEGACKDEDKKVAHNFGVHVLDARKRPGFSEPLDWLGFPPQDHRIDVVVGHGVKLGRQVQIIRLSPQFQKCKWVHLVHTAPENLSKYKGYDRPTSRGEQKHWDEVDLCKYADLVVPVGPRLKEAYSSYLQRCKNDEDIFEIVPGLFNREFGALVQKAKVENGDDFKVLLCGRGDDEDFELKGYDIAVKAFTDQRLKGKRYFLLFVGAPDGKQDEVRRRLLHCGINDEQLTVRKFVQNRDGMKDLFCEVDLVIMPSRSEGFGLVALEALSAGLPVLVGRNSGFARTVQSIPFGAYSIVDSEDPVYWAEAIEGVHVKHRVCLQESQYLREVYGQEYCWKRQCEALVDKLWRMVHESSTLEASTADSLLEQQPIPIPQEFCQADPTTMQKHVVQEGAVTLHRKNARMSGHRRTSKSSEEKVFEGMDANEIRERSNPQLPAVLKYEKKEGKREDEEVSGTSREEPSLCAYGDSLIKLLISVSGLSEEQEGKVYIFLAPQVQTFVESRDYSSNKQKGVRALTDFINKAYEVSLMAVNMGSLEITVDCPTLKSLEHLWNDYLSGHLNKVAERYLVTSEMKKELGLETINLKTAIDKENYLACRKFFTQNPGEADSAMLSSQQGLLDQGPSTSEMNMSPDYTAASSLHYLTTGSSKKALVNMYRRNKDLEKSLAKSFVAFLESENRKEDMPFQQLKQIYEKEFRPLCGIPNISFSRIINALSYDLNQCQRLQDRVVFGGGEQAALQLLATGGADDLSDDENEDEIPSLYCKICKRQLGNAHAYHTHMASVGHRQQGCLQKIRKSLEKADLVFDKNGINVTSMPPADENGVVELCVEMGVAGRIELIMKNTGEDTITVQDITLLWSVNIFDYSEIKNVGEHNIQLVPGSDTKFNIGCKRRREYGYFYVPAVITFKTTDNVEFHILRFLSVRIVSDLYDYLKQTSVYKPPPKAVRIPMDVVTIPGISLPPLARNGLVMWQKPKKYEIPPTIKAQIIKSNKVGEGLKERLRKTLTFDCYKEKFSTLLYIEELQMQKDIRKYDMKEVEFQQDREDRRFLILEVPGLAENRPSVLRGDKIFAYEHGVLKRRYEGIVHKVQQLDVKLGFGADMPFVKGKKFDIQFTFTRLPIQMEHRACENIASLGPEMRPVLFPQEGDVEQLETININRQFRYYDRKLNSEQQLAVQRIVSGWSLPAPYLVFGPPGTGKTVTLVEAIKQVHHLIDSSIILACAPENSAADLLVERLLDHVDKGKLFRMYAASRPWDFVPQKLKDARVVNFDSVRHDVFYPSKEELMTDYRIIVTTLVTAGRLVSADFARNHFTHIFIDEAGHATEPECIIPVANLLDPASGQLVLAGDPKQLGPIIRSPISQEHGLETSLLERLMTTCSSYSRNSIGSYDSKLLTKLLNNYRSHRAIIEIPKQMFYDNELNECAGDFRNVMLDWEELPNKTFPIIFHPVYGKDEREANSPSFFNVAEVDTIERYLKKLLDDNVRSRRLKHLKPEMIGVISPYKRQVQKIQKMIEKRRFLKGIKVGSVEEFQGQERRIIILSTVRSTKKEFLEMDKDFHLGFLHNPKRFNVAITRAQALLILIGNPDMLRQDENWTRFLDYCRINNACVDVESKGTVEDIAETLRRLNLMSAESSESCDDSEISLRQHVEHPEWKRRE